MPLIRPSPTAPASAQTVRLDLGDLARQGDAAVVAARAEAQRIIEAAHAERQRILAGAAEEGRKQGHTQGLAEGRKAGAAEGRSAALAEYQVRLSNIEAQWTQALGVIIAQRDRMLLDAREDVLRVAIRMGELVVRRRLEHAPEIVADQVAAVLDAALHATRVQLRLHPDDAPYVRDALPALIDRVRTTSHTEITEDPAVTRGSVIAALPGGGSIDASIETQLRRIVELLMPSLRPEPMRSTAAGPVEPVQEHS